MKILVLPVLVVMISFIINTHLIFASDLVGDTPNLSISMSNNAIIMTPTVSVSGTATDNLQISSLTWNVDNGNVMTIPGTIPGNSISWSLGIPDLSNGLHALQINATNSAGLVTSKTILFTLYNDSPVTIASLPNGTYKESQIVKLESNEPAVIFYTLDGTTPAMSSPHGQDSITLPEIRSNTILKFFAVDAYGAKSDVNTLVYMIDNVTSSPAVLSNASTVVQSTQKIYTTSMLENKTVSSVSVHLVTPVLPVSSVVSSTLTIPSQNMTMAHTNSTLPTLIASNSTASVLAITPNMTAVHTNSTLSVMVQSNSTASVHAIIQNMTAVHTNSTLPTLTPSNSTASVHAIIQNMTAVHTNSTLPVLAKTNSTIIIPVNDTR
ncbi:chitobiase/beta-hexosaminidase C-terminal domain-containing protein [Candidatus Nitrosotalea bavarica]|uniref:chitobiase/beta-hexosaminidase C-terminal domain-containing protein n=1 Tax=Candidatus Nitrosotalea bavarica TaxID=1903277 RepID=UPI0013FE1EB7|nr:chitobiase/beta-hexosaminidase C-terminal domain-containing protein [Candidatus Nitrosotalea bavarica]